MSGSHRPMNPCWLGMVGYRRALRLQEARRRGVIAGWAPDSLWMLEHPPVITTGRRDVDWSGASLEGIEVIPTHRGGLATWHGPGQLVGYLIADVSARGLGVRRTVRGLEDGLIAWLGELGVEEARRDEAFPGVWVGRAKIASVGMHFRRGVSMHGFSLNLTCELDDFSRFTPCGIPDVEMTRLADVLSAAPPPVACWRQVAGSIVEALENAGRSSA